MAKKVTLVLVIFLIVLLALSFGEAVFEQVFQWISHITGILVRNFGDLFAALFLWVQLHLNKVLLAAILTVPISVWVLRSRSDMLQAPTTQRRIAIVLAIFLGWLGAHRFYLGQIGWGLVYLVLCYVFMPLAVILGLIDAIRYLFMDEEAFAASRQP